ncbi:MAG: hypothetical protein U5L96_01305 [Owenweeksia sp.]|nr:hypothetical protein [Owenweeksia sp.]
MNRNIAQVLSYLFHPAVYPVLGVLAVLQFSPYHVPGTILILTLSLVFVGTYIIPLALSYALHRAGYIQSLEMLRAKDRRLPYLIGALCYYVVATLIKQIQLPVQAYLYLIASTLVIILHLFTLSRTKPSAHLGGIGGFTGLLMALSLQYSLNLLPQLVLSILMAGLLASARLALKAHQYGELALGYFSGLLVVFGVVYWVG